MTLDGFPRGRPLLVGTLLVSSEWCDWVQYVVPGSWKVVSIAKAGAVGCWISSSGQMPQLAAWFIYTVFAPLKCLISSADKVICSHSPDQKSQSKSKAALELSF